jgi:hypothetical protein
MTTIYSEADFNIGASKPFKKRKNIRFYNPVKKLGDNLLILTPIDKYNYYMGFTDLHAQLEAFYTYYYRLFRF